jgi:hypothetical protein
MRCILLLVWSVRLSLQCAHIASKLAGGKNYVPERIRAAGFTDLR